ncbi:GNAT family N-acetyltransferase [Nocardioides jishulii]|uniref:N-acetyltransferase n=1 Tax=Nocardioides jishulii TaxID=2575440 RepID=A0A4V5TK90_9ACTN|nr:GNAT family N-acetyltransferase [Nocardioides jishulii]QCX27796.1 N-acetyltransferase [Nocardioides jishulii]TKI62603.1 N-acetyltransferase [Nocardioides jishulii]
MAHDIKVTRNPDRNRYEATFDGESTVAGFVDYQETHELIVLTHTEVDPTFEGRGVANSLARAALDDVRQRGLKALVTCPFIIRWLRGHPEYRELLHNATPTAGGR